MYSFGFKINSFSENKLYCRMYTFLIFLHYSVWNTLHFTIDLTPQYLSCDCKLSNIAILMWCLCSFYLIYPILFHRMNRKCFETQMHFVALIYINNPDKRFITVWNYDWNILHTRFVLFFMTFTLELICSNNGAFIHYLNKISAPFSIFKRCCSLICKF